MTTVALDRRFYEWREDADGLANSQYRAAAGLSDGMLGWPVLLAKRRVVILAEAGSGKTEELTEQARMQAAAGKFAFYATVQDVGRDGLESALRPADRALGAVFGVLRGFVLVLAAAVIMGMTPMKAEPWWTGSTVAGWATATLRGLKPALPQEFGKYLP